jgi:hypothetical protein
LICLEIRIGGFKAFGGVRQNVDESLLLDEELNRNDHVLLVEDPDRTGVYGAERLPMDPELRSGIFGVLMSCFNRD